jgi:hypothetical protein
LKRQNFKLIKGGAKEPKITSLENRRFVSAFVTDTRLMGVVALSFHWKIFSSEVWEDFYQFFYFDAEEYGLDTYQSLQGNDIFALTAVEQKLIGGLGGRKVPVTQKEALYLLQHFASESRKLKIPLPEPAKEYKTLLEEPVTLSPKERQTLIEKICTPILSDYQLIHYFVMRCFARDWEGASYLIDGDIDLDALAAKKPATLCKNTIEEYTDENGTASYLCEALIDMNGKYELLVLEITVSNRKVLSATRRSSFRITSAEAAMMMNRPEYVTVYEILMDPVEFDEEFLPLVATAMQTNHENGRLFMEFKKDNDHVNAKVFSLNEDVYGLYYVSDFGQLIVAAYELKVIHSIEQRLQKSTLGSSLLATAKYEFKEPIVYDFIQSEFEDFDDFLHSLR